MKALLLIWSVIAGGQGVGIDQTLTPMDSMEACAATKAAIDRGAPQKIGGIFFVVHTLCVPSP